MCCVILRVHAVKSEYHHPSAAETQQFIHPVTAGALTQGNVRSHTVRMDRVIPHTAIRGSVRSARPQDCKGLSDCGKSSGQGGKLSS